MTKEQFKEFKKMWDELSNIPIDDEENIDTDFLHFPKGTFREDIWRWAEEKFDISIGKYNDGEYSECLYCKNMTTEPHFPSDCCGRGMCEDCYGNLDQGTDEQCQVSYMDDEDYNTIKPEFRNAEHLCFECTDIWQIKK